MKRVKVFFVVFMAIAVSIVFMSASKSKKDKDAEAKDEALLGIGSALTLNVIENDLGEENLANVQFVISKRVLLQYKDKLPPLPDGKKRDMGVWRGVVINRGTKGILHPSGASIRDEVSPDGVLKIIRVLFDEKNPSGYLEFGAWADEPDSRFELITYTGNKVLFGMSDLIADLEKLWGLSWTADEPQFTASWSGRELPYLQFQSPEEVETIPVPVVVAESDKNAAGASGGAIEDPKKMDKKARKVQGISVKK